MDQEQPTVSIIMPVYNAGVYLTTAVESILHQTYSNFELLIINDGSTDDSETVVRSFTDPRIRSFHQNNIGLTATLNNAIQLCRGKYIARMDQDDISEPHRIERQVHFLEENL
jgi:glycosyltransferase involved in cell wall biosynthesis